MLNIKKSDEGKNFVLMKSLNPVYTIDIIFYKDIIPSEFNSYNYIHYFIIRYIDFYLYERKEPKRL